MPRLVASAHVKGGKFFLRNRRQFDQIVKTWSDGEYTATFEKAHATRTRAQNDYYWAVVVPRIAATFKELRLLAGEDPKTTHEVLKSQFMDPELIRTGKIRGFISDTGLCIGTSTKDLNRLQFIDYLERISDHAAEYWKTYIPPPDPLWREHAEQEGDSV